MFYEAQPGDTVEKISARTGVPVDDIVELNPGIGTDGVAIPPRTIVRLDDEPAPVPETAVEPETVADPKETGEMPSPTVDPLATETLIDLYNKMSDVADALHSCLNALAIIVGSVR